VPRQPHLFDLSHVCNFRQSTACRSFGSRSRCVPYLYDKVQQEFTDWVVASLGPSLVVLADGGRTIGDMRRVAARRLVRRYGFAATYDSVLAGLLICGLLWRTSRTAPALGRRRQSHARGSIRCNAWRLAVVAVA
jgi:hypothetical protein